MPAPSLIDSLISFLDSAPTSWHAVASAVEQLKSADFLELSEREPWTLVPGGRYWLTRRGSALCAFVIPHQAPKSVRLCASHTDSPGLKLKPRAEIRQHRAILLGVEVYGAPLLTSWLNRDLGIAGKVLYAHSNGQVQEKLIYLDRYPLVIPQLAIHLDREVNDKGLLLNRQEHLRALAAIEGTAPEAPFLEHCWRQEGGCGEILGHDLFLVPLEKARLVGYGSSLLAASRIDSLASMHAALTALLKQPDPLDHEIKMIVFWDNEEVGSQTAQGACSPFLNQVLERIVAQFQGTREDFFCLINRSLCLSIDLAHALHPNHADKHDPQHQPFLGGGVVVKHNAQGRYATDAATLWPIQRAAALQKLSLQTFVSRNDIPCGSTIGPIQAASTGIPTVDMGCGQLSMHSCRELMSCQDHLDMCALLAGFWESTT